MFRLIIKYFYFDDTISRKIKKMRKKSKKCKKIEKIGKCTKKIGQK